MLTEINYITVKYNPWKKSLPALVLLGVVVATVCISPFIAGVIDWIIPSNSNRVVVPGTATICVAFGMLGMILRSYLDTLITRSAIRKVLRQSPYRYTDIKFFGKNEISAGDPKASKYFNATYVSYDTNGSSAAGIETFRLIK